MPCFKNLPLCLSQYLAIVIILTIVVIIKLQLFSMWEVVSVEAFVSARVQTLEGLQASSKGMVQQFELFPTMLPSISG